MKSTSRAFVEIDINEIHLFNSLLQLILCRRCHRIDILIFTIIFLDRVRRKHLQQKNRVRTTRRTTKEIDNSKCELMNSQRLMANSSSGSKNVVTSKHKRLLCNKCFTLSMRTISLSDNKNI